MTTSTGLRPRPPQPSASASTADADRATAALLRAELAARHPTALPTARPDGPRWQQTYPRHILLADLLCMVTVIGAGIGASRALHRLQPVDLLVAAAVCVGWPAALAAVRGYDLRFLGAGTEEFKRVGRATVWLTALVCAANFLAASHASRVLVAATTVGTGAALVGTRYAGRRVVHRGRRVGRYTHRILVVGTREDATHLATLAAQQPALGWAVVAACLATPSAQSLFVAGREIPVVGEPAEAAALAAHYAADTIAVTQTAVLSADGVRALAWELEGTATTLLLAPGITDVAGPRITVSPLVGLPLLHVEQPTFSGLRRLAKECLDRGTAAVLLLLTVPLLAFLALAVRCADGGPALFRQTRVGANGRTFGMLKFRTMVVDAERQQAELHRHNDADGVLFKMRRDPRVTALGARLRRASLDELPQLWNVLRGDMSLVGPRPPLPSEVAAYADAAHRRLLVKPGLTGLWQVSGRANLDWQESVRLDLYYVENWSPLLDLSILAKTGLAVLRGVGAY